MHGWLLKDIHFVWLETLTIPANNSVNIFLINPNSIILYNSFSSNIYDYPKYYQYQY